MVYQQRVGVSLGTQPSHELFPLRYGLLVVFFQSAIVVFALGRVVAMV
jgi:hypothetical protein